MVVIDTGFWLALANRNDSYHTQAITVLANLKANPQRLRQWQVQTLALNIMITRKIKNFLYSSRLLRSLFGYDHHEPLVRSFTEFGTNVAL